MKKRRLNYCCLRLISVPCRDLALCSERIHGGEKKYLDVSCPPLSTDNCPLDRKQGSIGWGGHQNLNILHAVPIMLSIIVTGSSTASWQMSCSREESHKGGAPGSLRARYPEVRGKRRRSRRKLNGGRCGALPRDCCRLSRPTFNSESAVWTKGSSFRNV